MIEVRDYQCSCGRRIAIPIKPDWTDPLYVMYVVDQNKMVLDMLAIQRKEIIELAGECVDAGVRPSILKRADEMLALLESLKKRFDS